MADEEQGKKRRRGRRRDRKDANDRPEDSGAKDDLSRGDVSGETGAADSDVPEVEADQPETADDQPEDEAAMPTVTPAEETNVSAAAPLVYAYWSE